MALPSSITYMRSLRSLATSVCRARRGRDPAIIGFMYLPDFHGVIHQIVAGSVVEPSTYGTIVYMSCVTLRKVSYPQTCCSCRPKHKRTVAHVCPSPGTVSVCRMWREPRRSTWGDGGTGCRGPSLASGGDVQFLTWGHEVCGRDIVSTANDSGILTAVNWHS